MERCVATAMQTVAATISRLAFDACLYNSQNFAFIRLPKECTTGSSIMPHKKNPDVFELIRAKSNRLQTLPSQITAITNNLPSGYFRDMQLTKEILLPAFDEMKDCLRMTTYIVSRIEVNTDILASGIYDNMFTVEEVNRLTAAGMPFRDAYKKVGLDVEAGRFHADRHINHTHQGSIGCLCNDKIEALMQEQLAKIDFQTARQAIEKLLGNP